MWVPNFSAPRHLELKIVIFYICCRRPCWNSKWRPWGLVDVPDQPNLEVSMSKCECSPKISTTDRSEFNKKISKVELWPPYWNQRWRPTQWSNLLDPAIFEISAPKYPCVQNFTLSAGCEHLDQFLLHICPTSGHHRHKHKAITDTILWSEMISTLHPQSHNIKSPT